MEPRRKKRFLDVLVDSLEAINFSNDASDLEVELIGERRLLFFLLNAGYSDWNKNSAHTIALSSAM